MAVERRTIWLSPDHWELLKQRADASRQSPSAWIRAIVVNGYLPADGAKMVDPSFATFRPVPKPSRSK